MPAYFQPHLETDCNICNISIAKHRKLTNSHIKRFDKEFSNHQFCRYNQWASRYLFYYKPLILENLKCMCHWHKGWSAIRDDLTWSVCVTKGIEISSNNGCFIGMGIFIRWSESEGRSDFDYLNLLQSFFIWTFLIWTFIKISISKGVHKGVWR